MFRDKTLILCIRLARKMGLGKIAINMRVGLNSDESVIIPRSVTLPGDWNVWLPMLNCSLYRYVEPVTVLAHFLMEIGSCCTYWNKFEVNTQIPFPSYDVFLWKYISSACDLDLWPFDFEGSSYIAYLVIDSCINSECIMPIRVPVLLWTEVC